MSDTPAMLGSEKLFAESITWQVWLAAKATYLHQQAMKAESEDGH